MIVNLIKSNKVLFGSLCGGDAFTTKENSQVKLKLYREIHDIEFNIYRNAIYVEDGILLTISNTEEVTLIEGEFNQIIK